MKVHLEKSPASLDLALVINALAHPVFTINSNDEFKFLNPAAETFFDTSISILSGTKLSSLVPTDSPLFSLMDMSRNTGSSFADYDILLESPRLGLKLVNIQVSPVSENAGELAITLFERSIAYRLRHQLLFRGAARSVSTLAEMLAHEVKNPLAGILSLIHI